MSPYAPRIALLALLPVLISAKSLPTWTVVGNCSNSNDSFVVWIEAENGVMAGADAIRGRQLPIEVFEGKHKGLLSRGTCD